MVKIITDSSCDLTEKYIDSHPDLVVLPLKTTYKNENLENMPRQDFYSLLENLEGEFPKTSQYNPDDFYEVFKNFPENQEILYFGLGSGYSGTYNSACLAKNMLEEERDVSNIHLYDSQAVTGCLAIMVDLAYEMAIENKTATEIIQVLEVERKKIVFSVVVGDLKYLYAGGRLSKVGAAVGGLLSLRPILTAQENVVASKAKIRGNKKTIEYLMNELKDKNIKKFIIIKCKETKFFKAFMEQVNTLNVEYSILEIGPVIATHVGPECFGIAALTD